MYLCLYKQGRCPGTTAKPHSSVKGVADLRTGGPWFDPQLRQYSFQGLMIVRIHSSFTVVRCFDIGYVGKQPVAWKEYCAEYWLKELQESMDRCYGSNDITEILLKTALNTIQLGTCRALTFDLDLWPT